MHEYVFECPVPFVSKHIQINLFIYIRRLYLAVNLSNVEILFQVYVHIKLFQFFFRIRKRKDIEPDLSNVGLFLLRICSGQHLHSSCLRLTPNKCPESVKIFLSVAVQFTIGSRASEAIHIHYLTALISQKDMVCQLLSVISSERCFILVVCIYLLSYSSVSARQLKPQLNGNY